ncbi:tetratricopeptide repeat protein [Marinobacterium sp. YM272]|uniref:tetratricopeptide repeat protein n=1 Tax=Marinobacterium sp. YM272 TaxID=3421654 RepID=UPI003D7F2A10
MKKIALMTTAGLLLNLQVELVSAASISAAKRAFDEQNYSEALSELTPLAQDGNPAALNMLGKMYENGWGVDADADTAKRYYERGARQGDLESVNSLRALKNKAFKKEFDSLLPDAEAGNAGAQNRIGEMYEFGQGVERDPDAAFAWYQKAADQGNLTAWHNLGRCYNFGTGVEQNYETAEAWYRKAAEQGHQQAMFFLGTLYATNHGGDTSHDSDVFAYAWLYNVAEQGDRTARAIESRLKMKLTEAQLNEAQALAEEYKTKYIEPFSN